LKGLGEIFYLPKKTYPRSYINASFLNDLDHGQNYYGEVTSDNIFAPAIRKNYVPIKYIKNKEFKLAFFKEVTPWMSNTITFTHKTSLPLQIFRRPILFQRMDLEIHSQILNSTAGQDCLS
jgi:hypothetical protein